MNVGIFPALNSALFGQEKRGTKALPWDTAGSITVRMPETFEFRRPERAEGLKAKFDPMVSKATRHSRWERITAIVLMMCFPPLYIATFREIKNFFCIIVQSSNFRRPSRLSKLFRCWMYTCTGAENKPLLRKQVLNGTALRQFASPVCTHLQARLSSIWIKFSVH